MLIQEENGEYINIGKGWTLLATQCYLQKKCDNCLYYIYCRKLKKIMLKKVVKYLLKYFGKPNQFLLDQAEEINYINSRVFFNKF